LKTVRALLLGLLAAGMITACSRDGRRVRIATLTELTGTYAAYGDGMRTAAVLAVEERRAALEDAGWRIELTAYDAHLSAQDFSAMVSRIAAQPDVACAVVHANTADNFLAATQFRTAGIPVVFPAETAPIPETDLFPNAAWLSPDDRAHGAADAEWTAAQGNSGVFLVTDAGEHSQAIAEGFLHRADKLGLRVVEFDRTSRQDSLAWALSINSPSLQLLYYVGPAAAIPSILSELEKTGYRGAFLFAEGEPEDTVPADFLSNGGPLFFSPATLHSEPFFVDERFAAKFRSAYRKDPPALSELGYDAAALCLQPLLDGSSEDGDPEAFRSRILSAWEADGSWEGIGGTYPLGGRRSCRAWIFSPPGGANPAWSSIWETNGAAGTQGC
jgi:ABC-type branched-subunit amino acid transport system substrate-binding protein